MSTIKCSTEDALMSRKEINISLQMVDVNVDHVTAPFFFCMLCGKPIRDAAKAFVYYCNVKDGCCEKPPFTPVTVHEACARPTRDGKQYFHPIDRKYLCWERLASFLRHVLHNSGLDVNQPKQLKKLRETDRVGDFI